MALAMARPWKHPKTGIYWLRKRVPDDLIAVLGKREEKRSLKTRDAAEAKRLHAAALSALEAQWANLRTGPRTLTEIEAHALAAPAHDSWLRQHRDNPSEQVFWPTRLFGKLWAPPEPVNFLDPERAYRFDPDWYTVRTLEQWCSERTNECLKQHGLVVDEDSRLKLAKAIAAAVQRASLTLARYAQGDFQEDTGDSAASQVRARDRDPRLGDEKPVRFDNLVNGWASERRPTEKTLYSWRRVLGQLAAHLGHDDASRVRAEDLISWKAALVEAGLRAKTIRETKLAPVRAILQWAVNNGRLGANPAQPVTIDVKVKPGEAKRGFTDEEARIVLRAALKESDGVRRWVPCQWRTVSLVPRNNSELQKQISEDPIGKACECREKIEKLEEGYQRGLYEALAFAYAIAWHLERHWEDWVAFVNDPFFLCFKKRPKPKKHRGEILLYVMYFVFNSRSKQRRDRAWKYARALSIYNNKGVPSAEVAAKIEKDGGVERLCARAIKEQPRRRKHEASESYFVVDAEESRGEPRHPRSLRMRARASRTTSSRWRCRQKISIAFLGRRSAKKPGLPLSAYRGSSASSPRECAS